jgi:hypothetical protein
MKELITSCHMGGQLLSHCLRKTIHNVLICCHPHFVLSSHHILCNVTKNFIWKFNCYRRGLVICFWKALVEEVLDFFLKMTHPYFWSPSNNGVVLDVDSKNLIAIWHTPTIILRLKFFVAQEGWGGGGGRRMTFF